MNTNNQLRFARVGGGGGETLLWLGTGNVVTNCDQALTVDCVGARLTLHLNGGRLATVLDLGGPTTGGIGLYGGNTQGVRFL